MTPSRNTCIAMMLLAVLGVAAGRSLAANAAARPVALSSAPASTNARYTGTAFLSPGRGRGTEPVLVVPGKEMDAETAGRMIEDLTVMGRIIEKNTAHVIEPAESDALTLYRRMRLESSDAGPAVLFSSPGRVRPLYVAGYGALFFIQVDFPLLPPTEAAEKAPAKDESDAVWAETRRSILEPETPGVQASEDAGAPLPYSRERVGMLKSALTSAMKHATNVRGLEVGESLTIVVQGTSPQTEGSATGLTGSRSTLTLLAKKADVDAYGKGEIIQAQFEQRLQVVSY